MTGPPMILQGVARYPVREIILQCSATRPDWMAARDAKLPRAEDNVGIIAVAHSLRAGGFDASEDGTVRGTPLVPIAFSAKDYGADAGDTAPTLRAMNNAASQANGGGQIAIAIQERAVSENPAAGPEGAGFRQDGAA